MTKKDKEAEKKELSEKARRDATVIPALLDTLSSRSTARFQAAKELSFIAETDPEMLYPHFSVFTNLLDGSSSVLLWNSIVILAHLTRVDEQKQFDDFFERYYSHLWDGKLVTAANITGSSSIIARARPDLAERIVTELLKVDQIPLPTAECREVARGHTLVAFADWVNLVGSERKRIMEFAHRCLESTRVATRSKAENLLKVIRD